MSQANKPWWQDGVELFSEVTGFMVGPIIGALYLGRYLDNKYKTEPWFFVGLTVLGVGIAAIFITRLAVKYIKQAEKDSKNNKKL